MASHQPNLQQQGHEEESNGDGEPAAPKLSRGKGTSQAKADVVKAAAATKFLLRRLVISLKRQDEVHTKYQRDKALMDAIHHVLHIHRDVIPQVYRDFVENDLARELKVHPPSTRLQFKFPGSQYNNIKPATRPLMTKLSLPYLKDPEPNQSRLFGLQTQNAVGITHFPLPDFLLLSKIEWSQHFSNYYFNFLAIYRHLRKRLSHLGAIIFTIVLLVMESETANAVKFARLPGIYEVLFMPTAHDHLLDPKCEYPSKNWTQFSAASRVPHHKIVAELRQQEILELLPEGGYVPLEKLINFSSITEHLSGLIKDIEKVYPLNLDDTVLARQKKEEGEEDSEDEELLQVSVSDDDEEEEELEDADTRQQAKAAVEQEELPASDDDDDQSMKTRHEEKFKTADKPSTSAAPAKGDTRAVLRKQAAPIKLRERDPAQPKVALVYAGPPPREPVRECPLFPICHPLFRDGDKDRMGRHLRNGLADDGGQQRSPAGCLFARPFVVDHKRDWDLAPAERKRLRTCPFRMKQPPPKKTPAGFVMCMFSTHDINAMGDHLFTAGAAQCQFFAWFCENESTKSH